MIKQYDHIPEELYDDELIMRTARISIRIFGFFYDNKPIAFAGLIPFNMIPCDRVYVWFYLLPEHPQLSRKHVREGKKLLDLLGKIYKLYSSTENETNDRFARLFGFVDCPDAEGVLWRS